MQKRFSGLQSSGNLDLATLDRVHIVHIPKTLMGKPYRGTVCVIHVLYLQCVEI